MEKCNVTKIILCLLLSLLKVGLCVKGMVVVRIGL